MHPSWILVRLNFLLIKLIPNKVLVRHASAPSWILVGTKCHLIKLITDEKGEMCLEPMTYC